MILLPLTDDEARDVREAILETRLPWSPVLDRITKTLQAGLDHAVVELVRDDDDDEPESESECPTCGASGRDQSCVEWIDGRQVLVDDHGDRG